MTDAALQCEREPVLSLPRRRSIAEHPWRWFFLVALVPAVIVALPGSLSFVRTVNVDGFAVLAALLVAWGCDTGEKAVPRTTLRRVVLFAAVLAAWIGLPIAFSAASQEVALGFPAAAFTSFAIASIYSPTAGLRELAAPLFRLRATPAAWLVALLPWPALAALGVAITRAGLVSTPLMERWLQGDADFLLRWLAASLLLSLPAAIAWYGFATRRLLLRLSPLATALVVGVVPWLPVHLPASIWFGSFSAFAVSDLLVTLAVALVAVWIYGRSRGSLLPLAAFLVVAHAMPGLLAWVGLSYAAGDSVSWLMLGLQWLLAAVLVIHGRMWRRPRWQQRSASSTVEQRNAQHTDQPDSLCSRVIRPTLGGVERRRGG